MDRRLKTERDRVKYVALALGMTVKQLSAELGFKPSTLATYLSKKEGLTLTALTELYKRYGVSMDWLKFGAGEPFIKK